jgi:FAD dependent oxidoreductase TIGR03364
MIWPIGQEAGATLRRALHSRERWLELSRESGLWVSTCGSLHLAYRGDEQAVLEEFADRSAGLGYECRLLTPGETRQRCPAVRAEGLLGALWSATELCVDPREAIARLTTWLQERHGVQVRTGTTVTAVDMPNLRTADGETWQVRRTVVCSGVDFETLFPQVYAGSGVRRCKLQMMRTVPQPAGFRLGVHLASGLTLCHYASFQSCPSQAELRRRFEDESPEFLRYGIHVMASQNALGEVIIGDSHEYDEAIEVFDKSCIDDLILGYLGGMVDLPDWTLAARWHGLYAKHPSLPLFTAEPQPAAHIVAAPGGAGMTLAFGWADELWDVWEGNAGRPADAANVLGADRQ